APRPTRQSRMAEFPRPCVQLPGKEWGAAVCRPQTHCGAWLCESKLDAGSPPEAGAPVHHQSLCGPPPECLAPWRSRVEQGQVNALVRGMSFEESNERRTSRCAAMSGHDLSFYALLV